WLNHESGSPYILSLQNGMGNEQVLSEYLDESKIIGGLAVRIGADVIKPANVTAVGVAQVIMGAWPHNVDADPDRIKFVSEIVEIFNQAGIPSKESDNICKELWRKLMINNGTNALSALIQKDTKYLSHHEEYAILMKHMMQETALASHIDGSDLKEPDVDEMFQLIYDFDAIKPSMLIDREKGRTLELDEICGVVIKSCEALGKDAPYTRTIYTLLKNMGL
ncbi:MAG: ketopantoate reductase C-terminal domain-containing protein, partial [Gammaproteobacteria bacterium]